MKNTKQKILDGAQAIFADNSFHGTALDTLLGSVNVSKGSFFHHFRSKDDLLMELIDLEAEVLFDKLNQISQSSSNALASLNNFLNWRLESFNSTGRLIHKFGTEIGKDKISLQKRIKKIYGAYLSYIIQLLTLAKRNGQLVKSTPIKELANFILYGLEGGVLSVTLIDSKGQYEDVVAMIKRVVRSYRLLDN